MRQERLARAIVVFLALAIPLGLLVAGALLDGRGAVELRGRMAETGGWDPAELVVRVGEPLRLRLTSDDVVHGFAIGKLDFQPVDVRPGEMTEATLTFTEPGRYTYYCTRWCGPDHWRMRGTIEVTGLGGAPAGSSAPAPLYMELGLDLDAPHPARHLPAARPSAERAAGLSVTLPAGHLDPDRYLGHSPDHVWEMLRADSITRGLSDMQVWDLVAGLWARNTTPEMLSEGERLYRANCAACHGEGGAGDGVIGRSLGPAGASEPPAKLETMADSMAGFGHGKTSPADFTDPATMLGASPALLEGKIIRGGMGTGMPYWGPIFTERQVRALVDYLWTFQLELGGGHSTGLP